jgi:hypothetical protein
MYRQEFDMQSVAATAAAAAGEAPEAPAGRRNNASGDTSLDKDNKEERHASGDAFHAPPESQLDCQGVSRKGGVNQAKNSTIMPINSNLIHNTNSLRCVLKQNTISQSLFQYVFWKTSI